MEQKVSSLVNDLINHPEADVRKEEDVNHVNVNEMDLKVDMNVRFIKGIVDVYIIYVLF